MNKQIGYRAFDYFYYVGRHYMKTIMNTHYGSKFIYKPINSKLKVL